MSYYWSAPYEQELEPPDCWPREPGIGSGGVPPLYEDSDDYNSEEDDEDDE